MKKRLLWLCFGVYCALMLWLLFGQRLNGLLTSQGNMLQNINLRPFDTIRRFAWVLQNSAQPELVWHAVVNLAGNVVMFVVPGLLLPQLFPKLQSFWRFFLWMTAAIVTVELLQLVTLLGSCDIDDLLLNLLGACIGFLIWKLLP